MSEASAPVHGGEAVPALSAPALSAHGVTRVFTSGGATVGACSEVSLEVHSGELLVVRGPSGSGKTTLLNMLGGLDRPTSGQVLIGDRDLSTLTENDLVELRREQLGFVFQGFGLIPVLSAFENVELPLRMLAVPTAERSDRVRQMLDRVGLGDHTEQRPGELSGGQQQRVGLARALVARPSILIADEPTGQLDSGTAASMMELMASLVHSEGIAAVVSTHDPQLMRLADTVLELHDGRVSSARPRGRHAPSAS